MSDKRVETIYVECSAPMNFFEKEWDDITEENQQLIMNNDGLNREGLNCEGSGNIGWWCEDCRWGKIEYE